MRILIFILLVALSSARAVADIPYSFTDSGATENLFARIYCLTRGSTKLSTTEKISLCFLTKTNEEIAPIVYFPKPEYFCQMQLLDSNGIAVSKTWVGEKHGRQFSELKAYSWESVNKKGNNTTGNILGIFNGSDKPDMTIVHTNTAEGRDLPSVQELFKIKKSGNYKLLLQFQIFKRIGSETNHTFKIVRLPQMEIPIGKPDNE